MSEIWNDIENTSGRYQISNEGRFRKRTSEGYKIVDASRDVYGYRNIRIKYDGSNKYKQVSIHRLVATAFINNPYNLPIVHHIDEDKDNNHATNLFWCTHAQNHSFAISARNGIIDKHRVIEQYTLSGEYVNTYSSYSEAYRAIKGRKTKGSTSLISRCCQGKKGKRTAYGYIWKYGKGDPMYEEEDMVQTLFEKARKIDEDEVKRALESIIEQS